MRKTETPDCQLPSHRDFAGSTCVVCGAPVPQLPWTSEQWVKYGRATLDREALLRDVIEPSPDPADTAVPKSPDLLAAEAEEAVASAAHQAALGDFIAVERALGNVVAFNSSGAGNLAGDTDEAKRDQAQRMRPQALEAVDEASDALLQARIEVQRLTRAHEARVREWRETQRVASGTKPAVPGYRAFMARLGR